MRENRKSGSEGGAGLIPRPDPYPGLWLCALCGLGAFAIKRIQRG